jgi:hypothetical protein
LTFRSQDLKDSLLVVVVVWMIYSGQIVATGPNNFILTIYKVLLFVSNSTPLNLSHRHKYSQIQASTRYFSIHIILVGC